MNKRDFAPAVRRICAFITACAVILTASCGDKVRVTDTDQLAPPEIGETIAVMHTSRGDIYFRLFPEDAPKAVDNFTSLAEDGKYDGVSIFRSERNYLLQSGDYENNDGTGGKSKWGKGFGVEISSSLHNIRGALGMARSSDRNGQGSQFYVVTRGYVSVSYTEQLKDTDPDLAKKYEVNGGIPELDGDYTVFGQVFAGFAVLDALNSVETDDDDKPVSPIYILSVEITQYSEDMPSPETPAG